MSLKKSLDIIFGYGQAFAAFLMLNLSTPYCWLQPKVYAMMNMDFLVEVIAA